MQDNEDLGLPQGVVAMGELLGDGHQIDDRHGGAGGHHENLRCVWRRWLLVPSKNYQWPRSSCITETAHAFLIYTQIQGYPNPTITR
jgi:hypothetical protein